MIVYYYIGRSLSFDRIYRNDSEFVVRNDVHRYHTYTDPLDFWFEFIHGSFERVYGTPDETVWKTKRIVYIVSGDERILIDHNTVRFPDHEEPLRNIYSFLHEHFDNEPSKGYYLPVRVNGFDIENVLNHKIVRPDRPVKFEPDPRLERLFNMSNITEIVIRPFFIKKVKIPCLITLRYKTRIWNP
jgi:hypothetical protein